MAAGADTIADAIRSPSLPPPHELAGETRAIARGFTCQNDGRRGLALPLVLDIRRIRNDHDAVRAGLARRADEGVLDELERVRGLDETARDVVAERDELRSRIKDLSAEVAALRRDDRGRGRRGSAGREP